LLLLVSFTAQAGDDYLSILEAEADDTDEVSQTAGSATQAAAQATRVKHDKASEVIEAGLSFNGFEEMLNDRYSGSNFLYVKLSDKKRKRVYKFYKSDNRITEIREEIVRQLSSS